MENFPLKSQVTQSRLTTASLRVELPVPVVVIEDYLFHAIIQYDVDATTLNDTYVDIHINQQNVIFERVSFLAYPFIKNEWE